VLPSLEKRRGRGAPTHFDIGKKGQKYQEIEKGVLKEAHSFCARVWGERISPCILILPGRNFQIFFHFTCP